jgi:hypothetical protein
VNPGDTERLAALLAAPDRAGARAALARVAGPDLARLAYLVLQHRLAAEAAAATAVSAAVRRAKTAGWRPSGPELHERLVTDVLADALRRYEDTREVDPTAARRPAVLPAEPEARAVIGAILVADVPVAIAARAAGVRRGRAERILRDAVATAGSERLLREVVAGPLGALNLSIGPGDAEEAAAPRRRRQRWGGVPGAAVAAAALGVVLIALATRSSTDPTAVGGLASVQPTVRAPTMKGPPLVPTAPGELPTLETCGIGPPDAPLAYAGWLTVADLGVAPPDADPGQPFYALVPAGDAAWNPPGLSRRIMPAVRGRLACLTTASGLPPTVVGLPAGWTPPELPSEEVATLAECRLRPPDASLAYQGFLTAAQLGLPVTRPVYALVTRDRVNWAGAAALLPADAGTREMAYRFACFIDPDSSEPRREIVPDDWEPPGAG